MICDDNLNPNTTACFAEVTWLKFQRVEPLIGSQKQSRITARLSGRLWGFAPYKKFELRFNSSTAEPLTAVQSATARLRVMCEEQKHSGTPWRENVPYRFWDDLWLTLRGWKLIQKNTESKSKSNGTAWKATRATSIYLIITSKFSISVKCSMNCFPNTKSLVTGGPQGQTGGYTSLIVLKFHYKTLFMCLSRATLQRE